MPKEQAGPANEFQRLYRQHVATAHELACEAAGKKISQEEFARQVFSIARSSLTTPGYQAVCKWEFLPVLADAARLSKRERAELELAWIYARETYQPEKAHLKVLLDALRERCSEQEFAALLTDALSAFRSNRPSR